MNVLAGKLPSHQANRDAVKELNRAATALSQEGFRWAKMAKDAPTADLDAAWLENANEALRKSSRLSAVADWLADMDREMRRSGMIKGPHVLPLPGRR